MTAPKGRVADWTEERGARNERHATREVGGCKRPGGAMKQGRASGWTEHAPKGRTAD